MASTSWNGRGLSKEAASPRCRPGLCRSDAVGHSTAVAARAVDWGRTAAWWAVCAAGAWCLVTFGLVLHERATAATVWPLPHEWLRRSRDDASILMVLLLPWPGGGLWRAVFLTVRDNQVPALRQLLELSQFQANIATPGAGEHVLPPEVRTMRSPSRTRCADALPPVPAACGQ